MKRIIALLFGLACALSASAHEFWMLPDRFQLPAPGATTLSLAVGQEFTGDLVGFSRALLAQFVHVSAAGRADLRSRVPVDTIAPAWRVQLARPGTHLLAITTAPSEIVLPAEKFNDYLRLEGLHAVLRERERTGQDQAPGRERYRRNIKTLVQVGSTGDNSYAASTAQQLEIMPLSNPAQSRSGEPIGFRLLFDGRPLPGALVKFWQRRDDRTQLLSAVSDGKGQIAFTPPSAGTWMVSVVHMIPAPDAPAHDWDSFWGNLTFALPR
jgi:hypothetical protein